MLDKKVNIKTGSDFPALTADKYRTVIYDVELENRFNKFKGEDQEVLKYTFLIIDSKPVVDSEYTSQARRLWLRATPSSHVKSWFYKLAKATYNNSKMTSEDCAKIDPNDLVGRQVDCMVDAQEAKDGSGRVFNNILSLSPASQPLSKEELQMFYTLSEIEVRPELLDKAEEKPVTPVKEDEKEVDIDDVLGK